MGELRGYSSIDVEAGDNKPDVILAFVNQASPDIRKKKTIDMRWFSRKVFGLLEAKVYNNIETPENR